MMRMNVGGWLLSDTIIEGFFSTPIASASPSVATLESSIILSHTVIYQAGYIARVESPVLLPWCLSCVCPYRQPVHGVGAVCCR